MFIEITTITFLVILIAVSKKTFNTLLLGETLVSFVIGLGWETATRELWTYNKDVYSLFIMPDIPLVVVLSWCLVFDLTVLIALLITRRLKSMACFIFASVFLGTFIGTAFEYLGYTVLKGWEYWQEMPIIPFLGVPIGIPVGYFVLMLIFIPTIKFYDEILEQEI